MHTSTSNAYGHDRPPNTAKWQRPGQQCSPSARGISPTAPYNSPGDLTNSVEALEEELEALIDAGVRAEAESGEEEENPQDDDLYD